MVTQCTTQMCFGISNLVEREARIDGNDIDLTDSQQPGRMGRYLIDLCAFAHVRQFASNT